jgi:homoserine kinase
MDETHFESQHCSWLDAHCTHWSRDLAHVPEPGHTTGVVSGHAFEQTEGGRRPPVPGVVEVEVPVTRQRGSSAAQIVTLVMSLQCFFTQARVVSLNMQGNRVDS